MVTHVYRPPVAYQRPQIFRRRTWEYYSLSWLYDRATQVYSIADVSGGLGPSSLFEGASPPVETGFIIVNDAFASPGHIYPAAVEPDGDPIVSSGGDTSRQSFSVRLYNPVLADWYGPAQTAWINNSAPEINPDADPDDFLILSAINVAMAPRDVTRLFVDTDDLTLSYSVVSGALLAGTSLSVDGSITGTPVAYGWPNTVTIRATDIAGAYADISLTQYVGDLVPTVRGLTPTATSALLTLVGFTVIVGAPEYDDEIGAGLISSSSPSAGALVEHGTAVTIHRSLGREYPEVPTLQPHGSYWAAKRKRYTEVV